MALVIWKTVKGNEFLRDFNEVEADLTGMAASMQLRVPVANSYGMVIFGADGDFSKRLLTPALYTLPLDGFRVSIPHQARPPGAPKRDNTLMPDGWSRSVASFVA